MFRNCIRFLFLGRIKFIIFTFILSIFIVSAKNYDLFGERYNKEDIKYSLSEIIERKIPSSEVDIDEQVDAFYAAQEEFDIPALLLVSIGYFESKYKIEAVGDGGRSIGILQVGRMGRKRCREYCGDMDTEREQIMCGGCWFRENIDWCGSLDGGMTGYACGHCKSINPSTRNGVLRRFRLWKNMHDNLMSN